MEIFEGGFSRSLIIGFMLCFGLGGCLDAKSQEIRVNSVQTDARSIPEKDTSTEALTPITDWFDEQYAIDVIESYEFQSEVAVRLYFKAVDVEKGLWEHLPTFDETASFDLKQYSVVRFFSPYLEGDILDALDAAKVSKSTVVNNSRYVELLKPEFGQREYLKRPDSEETLRLSFKLLEYGDVIEGSIFFRKNSGDNSIRYLRDLQPVGLPGSFFLKGRNVGEFFAPGYFTPKGIIFAIQLPKLIKLQSKEKK